MAEILNRGTLTGVSAAKESVLANEDSKKRRNVSNKKNADRIKNRISKSPKRRAGTPEPDSRIYTDDSEKDVSDGENLAKSREIVSAMETERRGKQNAGLRRFVSRREKLMTERSKSAERTIVRDTESEDDFEIIRKLHKSKELEEEKKESADLAESYKPKVKEELKKYVPKEMPPLIVAPKDTKKRKRHKSLPLQEFSEGDEVPSPIILKPKPRTTIRKQSTSEDEDISTSQKTSLTEKLATEDEGIRKRKLKPSTEVIKTENEEKMKTEKKPWFFTRWFLKDKNLGEKDKKVADDEVEKADMEPEKLKNDKFKKEGKEIIEAEKEAEKTWLIKEIFHEWQAHVKEHGAYYSSCQKLRNRCITDLILLIFYCGCGGLVFRFTEGAFESFYKCGVKRVKRDFIDTLWKYSQYMLEEDWKSQARTRLMQFENQLHSAHEAGMTTYSGQKSWSFLNALVYCLTVVTTIGYGHISPSTTTGRAITILYAVFGIPMFLILLADFGKLFTRGIKFLWAFVRRLYYTGSCRRVRKTAPVQEMMKGVQIMYDFAKTRKFSTVTEIPGQTHLAPPNTNIQGIPETPGTPNWSTFEIDDEFNLPISVAISILLTYIFFGAFLYWMWEEWSFFESFYFVFISMSTIGFGDFVPQHPIYMMLSIVYLVFGLALTSMCINVVQEKLSDTFRQASAKLGTTIGLSSDEPIILPQDARMQPELNKEQKG